MLKSLALNKLETAINHLLKLDSHYQRHLTPLANKTVHIVISDIKQDFYLIFSNQAVFLQSTCNGKADLVITGQSSSFAKMGLNKSSKHLPDDMEISGSGQLAQQLQQFFSSIDIDWEEHLSRLTGDVIANQIGQFVKKTRVFAKKALSSLELDTKEYLQEESNLLPTRAMIEDFCHDVDELRHAVARLEQRYKKAVA